MLHLIRQLSIDSLLAVGILLAATLAPLIAMASGRMDAQFALTFAGFAFSGASGILAAHTRPTHSPRMKLAECIVGSIAGAAFLSVAIYSFFERM